MRKRIMSMLTALVIAAGTIGVVSAASPAFAGNGGGFSSSGSWVCAHKGKADGKAIAKLTNISGSGLTYKVKFGGSSYGGSLAKGGSRTFTKTGQKAGARVAYVLTSAKGGASFTVQVPQCK